MEHQAQNGARSIDVTGLPEEAIRAVESHVAALREQSRPNSRYRSHEEWSKAFHEWANSHSTRAKFADWSRESIYADRGE
jgi:hypothetical protein